MSRPASTRGRPIPSTRFWKMMTEADWDLWSQVLRDRDAGIRRRYNKAEKRVLRLTRLHQRDQARANDVSVAQRHLEQALQLEASFQAMLQEETRRGLKAQA